MYMGVFWVVAFIIRAITLMMEAANTSLNVGKPLPDYTAQQPRRQSSSYSPP
jgi:hypothetical protein